MSYRDIKDGDFILHLRPAPDSPSGGGPRSVARLLKRLGRAYDIRCVELLTKMPTLARGLTLCDDDDMITHDIQEK